MKPFLFFQVRLLELGKTNVWARGRDTPAFTATGGSRPFGICTEGSDVLALPQSRGLPIRRSGGGQRPIAHVEAPHPARTIRWGGRSRHLQRQQDAWSIAPSKIAFDGIHDPQDFRDDRQDKLWNSVM